MSSEDIKNLLAKAEHGDAEAQTKLGRFYYEYWRKGEKGLEKNTELNYKAAFKWLSKAAAQGIMDAQEKLGVLYAYGRGTEQNYKEAIKWYRSAIEQGSTDALKSLAQLYHRGAGVEKNDKESARLILRAAVLESNLPQSMLNALYREINITDCHERQNNSSCPYCGDIREPFIIDSPSKVVIAAHLAVKRVEAGVFEKPGNGDSEMADIEQITIEGGNPDSLHKEFRCHFCGQRFLLSGEFYHGRGGLFAPVLASAKSSLTP